MIPAASPSPDFSLLLILIPIAVILGACQAAKQADEDTERHARELQAQRDHARQPVTIGDHRR